MQPSLSHMYGWLSNQYVIDQIGEKKSIHPCGYPKTQTVEEHIRAVAGKIGGGLHHTVNNLCFAPPGKIPSFSHSSYRFVSASFSQCASVHLSPTSDRHELPRLSERRSHADHHYMEVQVYPPAAEPLRTSQFFLTHSGFL